MKVVKLGALLAISTWLMGCGGGGGATVTITLSPTAVSVVVSGTQQFTATVNGSSNQNVTWAVNNIKGGNTTLGTISTSGLYTSPATAPSPATVTVTATSVANSKVSNSANVTIDSGIRVTVAPLGPTLATNETITFTATVTGTSNANATWSVNGVNNGNMTVGKICVHGSNPCATLAGPVSVPVDYLAPTVVPNPATVTVTATSVADTNKAGNSSTTIVAAAAPTLTQIDPPIAAQGSVFQDMYLTGTSFLSTSTVQVNGIAVPTTFLTTAFLRARVPDALLAAAGSFPVTVAPQSGSASGALALTVVAVRPAIIASTPDSAPQNGASFTVSLTGGYYGTPTTPSVTAEFNGQARLSAVVNSRQLNVTLQGNPDLLQAGLFPLVVRNPSVPASFPAISATNVAVEPAVSGISAGPTLTVGLQPIAVAINTATNTAVVANKGSNSISVINLTTNVVTPLTVGAAPTGLAVDNLRNIAAVVNSGSGTLSVVNLAGPAVLVTLPLPSTSTPFSVGLNPLTGRALVANLSTNTATVVDLSTPGSPAVVGTVSISTGVTPAIAIEPRLNWAIVTPGGSGTISIVDLGRPVSAGDVGRAPFVVATLTLTTSTRGIALNTETEQALLTDPTNTLVNQFSVLDQTVSPPLVFDAGEVAVAVNPLTNIAVMVNNVTNLATIVDLRTRLALTTLAVGTAPQAVAIDPASNIAVVANTGSTPGTVSILSLGAIRPLHITQMSMPTTLTAASPCATAPPLTVKITGNGFNAGSAVRLDETPLPPANVTFVSSRQLNASIPGCQIASPRRYIVDVLNTDGTISNETDLAVIQAITVGTSPQAVAVDSERQLAVVTNAGSNTISIVSLTTGAVSTPISVGINPQGVALLPFLGRALVANNGSNNATLIDVVAKQVIGTVGVGTSPLGVAINQDTGVAYVVNNGSNNVSSIRMDTGAAQTIIPVDQGPVAAAVDTIDHLLAITATTQNTLDIIDTNTNFITGRLSNFQVPTGVAFDPVAGTFLVANSLQNNLEIINALTLQVTPVRVGINPTSVDNNFQTGTLVTVNSQSRTVSVMDVQGQKVRAVLGLDGSSQFSVAIDPRTNIAVIADTLNNRILLVPLPR